MYIQLPGPWFFRFSAARRRGDQPARTGSDRDELGERLYADRTSKQRYDNTIALMRSMRGAVAKVEDNHLAKWVLAAKEAKAPFGYVSDWTGLGEDFVDELQQFTARTVTAAVHNTAIDTGEDRHQ